MIKRIPKLILFLCLFIYTSLSVAQGSVCADAIGDNGADPFCSATGIVFPNCNSANADCVGSSEVGPNYGCLDTQPFPAWYYLQIDDTGALTFRISQTANEDGTGNELDVDFICYGPFPDPVSPCTAQLTAANTVDCSYLPDAVETMNIPGATAGEFYLVLITNFSQSPGFINFQQTGGTGSTDCSILEATLGPNQDICGSDPVVLDGESDGAVRYEWSVFNETTMVFDVISGETAPTYTVTTTGRYQLLIEDIDGNTETDEILITFYPEPIVANPPMDLMLCDDDGNGFDTFDLTQNSPLIIGGQDPLEFTVTYHFTQEDAENYRGAAGDNVIADPDNFVNTVADQTIWARIGGTNQICFEVTSFVLRVYQNPVANVPMDIELCDNDLDGSDTNGVVEFDLSNAITEVFGTQNTTDFSVSLYESQVDADAGVSGTELPNTYTNISNPQTIYVRIENVSEQSCYETTSFRLIVNPLPVISPVVSLLQCDDDTDGISLFNLSEANILVSGNSINETFTYYLTEIAAINEDVTNQIVDFTVYPNPTPINSTVFSRIETNNGCFRTAQIDLVVSATQIPAGFNLVYNECDTTDVDDDDANGIATFDFSSATSQVEALYPPGQSLVVTYYENLADALAEENEIVDPSNHRNDVSPFAQDLYIRVDDGTDNECLGLGQHIRLEVDPLPLNNPVSDFVLCSDDPNRATFDLTEKDSEVTGTQTEVLLISYHRTEAEANNNTGAIVGAFTNQTNPQTIWVRVQFDENNNGVGDADECFRSTISFDLRVLGNPVLTDPDPIVLCSDQVNTVYDLTVRETQISGSATNITFTYYESQNDVDTNNPIANPTTYTSMMLTSDIIVVGRDDDNGCVSDVILQLQTILYDDFNLTPNPLETCELDEAGIGIFDLTTATQDILNLNDADGSNDLNASDYNIQYYQIEEDAQSGNTATIAFPSSYQNTQESNQTIYIRFDPLVSGNDCFRVVPVQLIVNELPDFTLEDDYVLCLENDGTIINLMPTDVIDTGLDDTVYDFQWYAGVATTAGNEIPGETGSIYSPTASGEYSVLVTNIRTTCVSSASTVVIESYPPRQEDFTAELISGAFSDNATVQVIVADEAIGEYEYRLDNGDWQTSPIFTRVSRGEHVIYVRDVRMCSEIELPVEFIVDYPRYFTPNGDGFHETWGIVGNDNVQINGIQIFNRFGKLLKDLGALGEWDGTYNGNLLPSSEYWFKVRYTESGVMKEFNASFSLIR
ncbi:gliding motility-associated C-terminal domain-containing protein [Aquimarina sp. BL5]|uniref:T9SS type B sorting domain-containing protein n=1 Tax=Aquimarina sp. BL5 TaxID=1714860 RepID=UPI000E51D5A5|nr:T9SS type B sorting domain-containing protein [Aquimarina sp. BL5]AXT53110.1 gliding motility-associated C-terminal domain-containing protein [Aquimarina sp. BL5]RKN03686.1 gliding motility-associated C-terminal domain-containing protein [Aquimarina sp. BL5]